MKPDLADIDRLPGVHRIENCSKEQMTSLAMEMTHAVYPHDEVYGQYCPIQDYINCPPEKAFEYLADVYTLEEWTYSTRDFKPVSDDGLFVGLDRLGSTTKIYVRVVVNREAMTVDFHCSWDQGEHLWMIYLMRVVPAELVLGKPGCVVLWTNCRHPNYDRNPYPETAPAGRKIWVGDMWPFFYAGHKIELDNLKAILEYRHANRLPMTIGGPK
ncbi:MAG TPA: hypothetical protein VKE98_19795 [Gemmataceae bacterium]|nr:hypothetical protein [Gemmataceae bacterium]